MLQPTTSDTRNRMFPFRRMTTRRAPRGVGQSSIDLLAMVGNAIPLRPFWARETFTRTMAPTESSRPH